MVSLQIRNLSHAYDGNAALSGINLSVEQGEIVCLLGASGCGKTTLLKLIAGLMAVQDGEILVEGTLLATEGINPPPEKRPIGLVFQEGALFPHMTVAQNVGFGISNSEKSESILTELFEHIGLNGFQHRYPHTLSGGQQQRVALARAIAPSPKVLLLDEPFAAVDIVLRRRLREQTRRLLKERNVTAILVTHDPDEAMEMADRIAVIENGKIVQFGSPDELYNNPASLNVGKLLGEGQAVNAIIDDDKIITSFGDWPVSVLKSTDLSGKTTLLCNPGNFDISKGGDCEVIDLRLKAGVRRVLVRGKELDTLWIDLKDDYVPTTSEKVTISPVAESAIAFG